MTDAAPTTSVVEALAGISMPGGLTPVIPAGVEPERRRAVFYSDSESARTVADLLVGELRRLGYSLRTVSAFEAIARRPGTEIAIVIHADSGRAPGGSAFPSVPSGSTVVEFTI